MNLSARKEVLMPEAARPQPSHFYRWVVLIFVSLAMFGNYYVYDCIAPVADLLAKQLAQAKGSQQDAIRPQLELVRAQLSRLCP